MKICFIDIDCVCRWWYNISRLKLAQGKTALIYFRSTLVFAQHKFLRVCLNVALYMVDNRLSMWEIMQVYKAGKNVL